MKPLAVVPDLVPLTTETYEGVIERYAGVCSRIPGVRAIYQFGSVGAPGLSDLDVVVVLADDAPDDARLPELSVAHPRWKQDTALARCFIHDVLVCNESQFERLHWAILSEAPRLVAGHSTPPKRPESELASTLRAVQALDFAVARIHELERLRERHSVSLRWLVPQLWSLVHTKRVLLEMGITPGSRWEETLLRLVELRATPLAEIRPQSAAALFSDVQWHYLQAIDLIADHLVHEGALPAHMPDRARFLADPRARTLHAFSPAGGPRPASVALLAGGVRIGRRAVRSSWTRADLPVPLLWHLVTHLAVSSDYRALADRISAHTGSAAPHPAHSMYRTVVQRRMTLVEENAAFLARCGIAFGRLSIPGVPMPAPHPARAPGTWRYELVKAALDRWFLPRGTILLEPRPGDTQR